MIDDKYETVEFGDLKPGDKLIGTDGKITEITKVFQKHLPDKMYELEMADGEIVQASGTHLWYCESDKDKALKEDYFNLAKTYFENNVIPEHNEHNPHYPLAIITIKFGDDLNTRLFIDRVCRSLGYSSSIPHVVLKDDGEVEEHLVYRYSFNDLVDFLHKMKESVINDNGYFYFGEVRTTDEIAELNWYNIDVNIPHKGEIL